VLAAYSDSPPPLASTTMTRMLAQHGMRIKLRSSPRQAKRQGSTKDTQTRSTLGKGRGVSTSSVEDQEESEVTEEEVVE